MKIQNLQKKIAGSLLGAALVLGMVALLSTAATAQRSWDGYPNWGGSYQLRQTALNAGFNDGSKEGRNDRARGATHNYQDFRAYNAGSKDYNSRYGDRELYRRYYQRAFASGYDTEMGINRTYDNWPTYNNQGNNYPNNNYPNNNYPNNNYPNGNNQNNNYPNNYPNYNPNRTRRGRNWDGYSNWGGGYQLRQTALNAGYNEGRRLGQNDRSRGRYSNYPSSNLYQNATKDYSSKLGDRELYRRYFRDAFENGYADGYEGF
ncbi:MAG: hypothetical protein ABIV21_02615 [Pyrinomonadaceae bacterium]